MPPRESPYRYQAPNDVWLEKEHAAKKKRKMILIGSILALVGLAIIGTVVGVVVANKNKNNRRVSNNTGSASSSGGNDNSGTTSDPNDPSKFTLDSRLKKSFYGMAYTPENSLMPNCGNKLEDVIKDIQLLSQLTTRVRLYGADCNQSSLVLEAIKQTKVDMKVFLGNYVLPDDSDAAYNRQRAAIKSAIETYGVDHIEGITVGNEYMLNYLTAHGASDPNSAIGNTGAQILLANIQDTKDMLASMNLPKTIPVGNSDAGSFFNTQVLSSVDYGLSNVHAWFANVTIDLAASWTAQFFDETNVQVANALPNRPKMYIAETGWPTKSSDLANANNGASDASIQNLQKFLDTFVCQANTNNTAYFYFEFFDEKWKDIQFGGVEGWWGLFNSDRTLKNVNLPDCPSP